MRFRWKCAGKGMAIGMAIRMTVFSICVTIEHTYIECYYFIADRLNAPQHHLIGTKVEYQLCNAGKGDSAP
jgi:hypothetical protein